MSLEKRYINRNLLYTSKSLGRVTRLPCPWRLVSKTSFLCACGGGSQVITRLRAECADIPEAKQRFKKEIRENWILFHFPSCFFQAICQDDRHVHIIFSFFIFAEDQLKQTHLSFVNGNIRGCLPIRMPSLYPITCVCGSTEPCGWE